MLNQKWILIVTPFAVKGVFRSGRQLKESGSSWMRFPAELDAFSSGIKSISSERFWIAFANHQNFDGLA
jgi:hypothetical protein